MSDPVANAGANDTPRIIGPYHLLNLLGRGSMGIVYRALNPETQQIVALKTLDLALVASSERQTVMDRFAREARIGQQLTHPGIVRVYDFGHTDELTYLIMELVQGRLLNDLSAPFNLVDILKRLRFTVRLLAALDHAHRHGVIHRDIKPSNVFWCGEEDVKLVDFGVAREEASELTRTGELVGTPAYMAPEQLKGDDVDGRSDLYAVGAVLYWLITGYKPLRADSLPTLIYQVLHVEPEPPSHHFDTLPVPLATALDGILTRALAKDPDQRFASARDFAAALMPLIDTLAADKDVSKRLSPAAASRQRVAIREDEDGTTDVDLGATLRLPTPADAEETAEGVPGQRRALDPEADDDGVLHALIQTCGNLATAKRLDTLTEALGRRLAVAVGTDTDLALARYCGEQLRLLAPLIGDHAPVPGQTGRGRSDWLGLVRLFALLSRTAVDLDVGPKGSEVAAVVQQVGEGLSQGLVDHVIRYGAALNAALFSGHRPDLLALNAGLLRLEALELALETLGAEAQVGLARQTRQLYGSQVMGRLNAMIQLAITAQDDQGRAELASLWEDVEELIALAQRLLAGDGDTLAAAAAMGVSGVATFAEGTKALAMRLLDELEDELEDDIPIADFEAKLRQVGQLYLFATRLDHPACRTVLGELVDEVHNRLESLAVALVPALVSEADEEVAIGRVVKQLSAIARWAQEFCWPALQEHITVALRNQVMAGASPARTR